MSNTDSPLHIAIRDNNIEIAKLLLANQCDLQAVNTEGLTPLQLATKMGNAEMVALLLQHGTGKRPDPSSQPSPQSGHSPAPDHSRPAMPPTGQPSVDAVPHTKHKVWITFWTVFYTLIYVLFYLMWSFYAFILQGVSENKTSLETEVNFQYFSVLFLVVGLSVGVVYLYCFCKYLYCLWEEVPVEYARTTPLKAAGLSLIPFFAWLWWFTAFVGLYKDMNKAMESYGLETRFGTTWINIAYVYWVLSSIIGMLANTEMGPAIGLGTLMLLMILDVFITVPTLWSVRNRVLEFVDIKSRHGR